MRALRQDGPAAESRILRRAAEHARTAGITFDAFRRFLGAGDRDDALDVLDGALAGGLRGWPWPALRTILRTLPGDDESVARARKLAGHNDTQVDLAPGNVVAGHLQGAREKQFTDHGAVRRHLGEAGDGHAPPFLVVGGLGADAYVAAREGELNRAQRAVARATTIAENEGLQDHPFLAGVVLARAELLHARGRTEEARKELDANWALLTEHEQIGGLSARPFRSAAQLLRARLLIMDAETDDHLPPLLDVQRSVDRASAALQHDEITQAEHHLKEIRTAEAATLRVDVALRRRAPEVAQRVLETWPAGNTLSSGLRRLLSRAALAQALDRRAEAAECVRAAIGAAETDGHVQVFLEARPTLWPVGSVVLNRFSSSFGPWRKELQRRLDEAQAAIEPSGTTVTRREKAVLEFLAGPLTHAQIAAALFVSENTLKSHCRNLYRKLGVGSRSDALSAARSRGWLPPEPQDDVVLDLDATTADVEL